MRLVRRFSNTNNQSLWFLTVMLGVLTFSMVEPVLAQEKLTRTLTVNGEGSAVAPTTFTVVSLGVQIRGQSANTVQEDVSRRTSAVVNFLKSRNVEQIETTGITLQPSNDTEYGPDGRRQNTGEYIATNIISFRTKTEQSGALINEAVKAGATRIDGVGFAATDAAIEDAQKQAVSKAILNAQAKVDAALKTLKVTESEMVDLKIESRKPPGVNQFYRNSFGRVDALSAPVIGSGQEINAFVSYKCVTENPTILVIQQLSEPTQLRKGRAYGSNKSVL